MTSESMRVLVVDANPSEAGAIPRRTGEVEGIEAVGVAHNRRAAWSLVQSLQPDVRDTRQGLHDKVAGTGVILSALEKCEIVRVGGEYLG